MATWAKGIDFKNSTDTARIGGVGIYGTDTVAEKLYLGLGSEPWNNNGLQITNNEINFKGNKVYHAGDKPTIDDIGAAASIHNHTSLTSVTSIGGAGASSSWGSLDITGSKGSWQGIHFKDYGYIWMVRSDGYTGMWKNAGNAVFAFDQNGALATGTVPWGKLSSVPSSFTPSAHTHNYADSPSAGGAASIMYLPRVTGSGNSANYQPGINRVESKEFGSDCSNLPSANWYHILTGQGSDSNYNTQLALGMTTEALYYRYRNANTWGNWRQIWHSGNFDPASKANLGADVSFNIVRSTSNGQGTNFAIGDDCWLGDINESWTVKLNAQDGSGKAYLRFGNGPKVGYGGGAFDILGNAWVEGSLSASQLSVKDAPGSAVFFPGGGDNATWSAQNVRLNCWWGFGIQAYDNKTRIVMNARTGDIAATGNFYTQDGHGEGRVSGFEPNRGTGRTRLAQGDTTGNLRIELINNGSNTGEFLLHYGYFYPYQYTCIGHPDRRWGQVYSTSGSISTSDSKLKENIKAINRSIVKTLDNDDQPTSYDFYNYIKNTGVYTFNYKREVSNDTQTWLGVLADEIPDNIFDKIGMMSKTQEEYEKEIIKHKELENILSNIPITCSDEELKDFENTIVAGTELTYKELKNTVERGVNEPVRMLNSSSQIAMLQEVLSIALNKIDALEALLIEKGL